VLEPAARAGTGLPAMLSWLVGTGAGAGMGLLIVVCGLASTGVGLAGYFIPAIFHAETRLPDHDELAPASPA
jgi:MFS transporter, DHA3 family, macrolide efflux protein